MPNDEVTSEQIKGQAGHQMTSSGDSKDAE
ncbi:hypothetical protein VTH82DRAFT_5984 [Thermothelomyces myriococcoides]